METIVHISNRIGQTAAGGLDEALSMPLESCNVIRIGCSDERLQEPYFDPARHLNDTMRGGMRLITADLPEKLVRGHYDGATNGFRWPLFHHRADIAAPAFSRENNAATTTVNGIMAHIVRSRIQEGVISPSTPLIVHDYHFIELGHELRKLGVQNPVGFFLHIPTPSQEVMEELNQTQQEHVYTLLDKLYAYDFVGLQSARDLKNLIPLIARNTPPDAPAFYETYNAVNRDDPHRTVAIGVFPIIGNNSLYVEQAAAYEGRPEVSAFLNGLDHTPGRPDIIAWERLDYSKGLTNKFDAVARALYQRRIDPLSTHFLQVAVPTRLNVPAYHDEMTRVVQSYNSLRNVCGQEAASLHLDKVERPVILNIARKSRACLTTPIRDGMNLVALEYLSVQDEKDPGVLVLSQTAGVAAVLGDAVVLVDPMRVSDITRGLSEAKNMPRGERVERHQQCLAAMAFNTNEKWQRSLIAKTVEGAQKRRDLRSADAVLAAVVRMPGRKP